MLEAPPTGPGPHTDRHQEALIAHWHAYEALVTPHPHDARCTVHPAHSVHPALTVRPALSILHAAPFGGER